MSEKTEKQGRESAVSELLAGAGAAASLFDAYPAPYAPATPPKTGSLNRDWQRLGDNFRRAIRGVNGEKRKKAEAAE